MIPSESEFQSFLSIANGLTWFRISGWESKLHCARMNEVCTGQPRAETALPTKDELTAHIQACIDEAQTVSEKLFSEPVYLWLLQQREYLRAHQLVHFGKRRSKTSNSNSEAPRASEWAEWCLREAQTLREHGQSERIEFSISRRLRIVRDGLIPRDSWGVQIVHALHEYYFTDAASWSVQIWNEFDEKLKAARKAVCEFEELKRKAVALGLFEPRARDDLDRQLERYENQPLSGSRHALITRNDPAAAERLFVLRAITANKSSTGKNKPEAIVELMGLPAFDHRYELRHIERLCREFADTFEIHHGKRRQATSLMVRRIL